MKGHDKVMSVHPSSVLPHFQKCQMNFGKNCVKFMCLRWRTS